MPNTVERRCDVCYKCLGLLFWCRGIVRMVDQEDSAGKAGGFASRFSKGGPLASARQGAGREGERRASATGVSKFLEKGKKSSSFAEGKKAKVVGGGGFAEATKKSRLDCLFLVRGKDKGQSAWHYVLVDKSKREMFLAKSKSGSMDVALYGDILYSGWGENPPEDIVKKVEEEFGA